MPTILRDARWNHIVLARKPMVHHNQDFRLADFISPALRRKAAAITKQAWQVQRILDQGSTSHCVGYAWAGFGISLPVFDNWDNGMGESIYYDAKIIDGEPGQEDGSDTRSGVQAFMKHSQLVNNAYAFALQLQDIIDWVKTTGPVIVGTNWYNNMFNPTNGIVFIAPGDTVAGGHEYEISGCDDSTNLFLCTNSWGTGFANGGQFYISYQDMQRLQNESGDACTTAEASPVPPAPTPNPVPVPTPTPAPGCLPVANAAYRLYRMAGGRR